jgi:hypothetical protein
VRDPVSHTYKTAGKVIDLIILISKFLERRQEDDCTVLNGSEHSLNLILS